MSHGNLEVVRRLINVGPEDVETALAYVHPEVELIPLRARTEGTYRGHDGLLRFAADTRESFERFEPRYELRDLGDRVLAWGTIHVRGRGSGVEMDVPSGGLFDFRDGQLVRWEDFGSKERALAAAGLPAEP